MSEWLSHSHSSCYRIIKEVLTGILPANLPGEGGQSSRHHSYLFVPFAVETMGLWSPGAKLFVRISACLSAVARQRVNIVSS